MLKDRPRLTETSSLRLNPSSPSSSEPEVSTSWIPKTERSYSSSDWDSSTMVSLSDSTRPQSTWLERLNPTSLMDTQPRRQSLTWSTREVMLRLTSQESPLLTTLLLRDSWARSASSQLKTWFTKSSTLVLTSRKPTTSCGHSNWTHPRKDLKSRDTHTRMVVLTETEKKKSTHLFTKCYEEVIC